MKKILCVLTALAIAAPAYAARFVNLSGDYGCGLFVFQLQRLEGTRTVMQNSILRAQGLETPATKAEAEKASAEVVRISNTVCRQVTGKFKVLESRPVPGGEAVRIEPKKYDSLWVLGPF